MNRFQQLLAAIFLTFCIGLTPAIAADPIPIRLSHPNVPKHPMGQSFIKFKELIEERSNNAFKVVIFDSSKFGNFDSVVLGLQLNMLQMGSAATPNLAPFSDEFLIFDLPFLFPDYPSTDKITDGPIGMKATKALEPSGIIGLGYIEIGFRNLWNSKRAISTLKDAKGLKIRSTTSKAHIQTLKDLGINPTPIAWGEVYTAMQQKTVDGIDIDLNLAWHNNFQEVNSHVTIVNSIYSPHLVMISKRFMESLSPEHKKLILTAFEEIKLYNRKLIRDGEKEILKGLPDRGLKVNVLSPEERKRWAAATEGVYRQFEDKIGKDLIEQAKSTIANR